MISLNKEKGKIYINVHKTAAEVAGGEGVLGTKAHMSLLNGACFHADR